MCVLTKKVVPLLMTIIRRITLVNNDFFRDMNRLEKKKDYSVTFIFGMKKTSFINIKLLYL